MRNRKNRDSNTNLELIQNIDKAAQINILLKSSHQCNQSYAIMRQLFL